MKFHPTWAAWTLVAAAACGQGEAASIPLGPAATVPIVALHPQGNPSSPEKIALGRALFFDEDLSASSDVSCASCHALGEGGNGAGTAAVSRGTHGILGRRNAPTVYNVGARSSLFWDGRASSLEAQVRGPVLNPIEMGNPDTQSIVLRVEAKPAYREAFARVFASERQRDARTTLEFSEIAAALACFERTLSTPNSPFDRAQRGEAKAMTDDARRGWIRFHALGCIGCHGGPTFGVGKDFFARFPTYPIADLDYVFGFTRDAERGSTGAITPRTWRIPSLRNVARTAPYFHNGSVADLETAVRIMGRAQLGKQLSDDDVRVVVAFLESLNGELPTIEASTAATAPRGQGTREFAW